jgi:hypothetical protein
MLTAESLLTLARSRVRHTALEWHYRCQDESLIAFSNHAMYGGGLLTIPSTLRADAAPGLRFIQIENGVYDAGANAMEAERVVDLVAELLAEPQAAHHRRGQLQPQAAQGGAGRARAPRLGRRRVRRGVGQRRSQRALDERPFVKNLEAVQGDERDVIIFTLAHAPVTRTRKSGVADLYVPARFGPLGQRGGERRLNVAISRAKQPATSSRRSSLTSSRSPRPSTRAHACSNTSFSSRIGSSGFRIPLAVLDPADPTRFALALLLHDGSGPSDPFDLYVHRPGVLTQRGWRLLSITAASWHRRRAEIMTEIEAMVPGCHGAVHSDIYLRHRAALARPVGATSAISATPLPPRRAHSTSANPLFEAAPSGDSGSTSAAPRPSAAIPAQPAWALAIADELFRAALIYLDRHGELGEGDLNSIVGGPRRARKFAADLDALRPGLPFGVEVTDIGGTKVYRKVAAA